MRQVHRNRHRNAISRKTIAGIAIPLAMILLATLAPPTTTAALAVERENAVVRAARKVGPAVVNVGTETPVKGGSPFGGTGDPFFDQFFRDFLEPRNQPRRYERTSLGSGVIIDGREGLILTNAHVVAQAGRVVVTLKDEREFEATVVGSDPDSDLAVLRIRTDGTLPDVSMGNSDDLMIGEDVIAIGNPFGFSHTVTRGVISALNRSIRAEDTTYHDFIQTDASINPGNSGGPLLNINGELIGVNTAIYAKAQGIGFAIPINRAKRVVAELVAHGEVPDTWIGVSVQSIGRRLAEYLNLPDVRGVLVRALDPGGPAAGAGIREGDVVVSVGGIEVDSVADFNGAMRGYKPGDTVRMVLRRGGRTTPVDVKAGAFPADRASALVWDLMGVRVAPASGGQGLVITELRRDAYLAEIGARPGDVILEIEGTRLSSPRELERAVVKSRHKSSVPILLVRGNQGYYVTVRF